MPLTPKQEPPYYEISTGPDPVGTKYYTATITQTGTDAPVAVVHVNTLGGTVIWTRTSAGFYEATLTGAFPSAKTIFPPFSGSNNSYMALADTTIFQYGYSIGRTSDNAFNVFIAANDFTPTDLSTITGKILIQVIVYP